MTGKPYALMQIFRIFFMGSLAVCWLFSTTVRSAFAAGDISVTAQLTRNEIVAGEMAELQIKVTGSDAAEVPQEIPVEGLQIRLTGQSTQVQMVNFKVSSSVVYSYIVMPLRTGKFTIPSVTVHSNAGALITTPLTLSVLDASNGAVATSPSQPSQQQRLPGMPGFSQPQPRRSQQHAESPKIAFAEITTPKKSLYVGEMLPVEIRYYFDAQYPVQVLSKSDFGSEGIVVERFPDPKESREDRNGTTYNVLKFHTLLSAIKPGSLDIPPAKLETQIQMPGATPPGFDDPIFQQMMGGRSPFTENKQVTVQTEPLHLEVLPLPKEGRPASFAGAVGDFDIDALVSNPHPAPGDPAVMSVKIGGKGNFNAMGAPVLTDLDGWRSYPPTEKFEGSDELSLAGVKTFDFTLIAQEQKHFSPGSEFSYFNPTTAKYVTLSMKPLPLEASPGNSAPEPKSSAIAQQKPSPQVNPSPESHGNDSSRDAELIPSITLHSWTTPIQRADFLTASLSLLVAALALAGILHFYQLQQQGGSPAARRRHRLAELMNALQEEDLDAAASHELAIEYLQLFPASERSAALLAELSSRRDLLKYGAGRAIALSKQDRSKLIESLRSFSTNPQR